MSDIPATAFPGDSPLWVGAAPLLIFLLVSAIDLALAKQFTDNGKAVISDALGGVWQWMVLLFLIALLRVISPVGRVRLGAQKPEPKFFDWCAVLICTLLAGWSVLVRSRAAVSSRPRHRCLKGSKAAPRPRWILPRR